MNRRTPFLSLLVAIAGCSAPRAASDVDHWFADNPPRASSYAAREWTPIDPAHVRPVDPQCQPEAERLLERAAFVPLSADDANRLAGEVLRTVPGTSSYLLRGLQANPGRTEGMPRVRKDERDGSVEVYTYVVTPTRPNLVRRPVVVLLDRPPTVVHLSSDWSW